MSDTTDQEGPRRSWLQKVGGIFMVKRVDNLRAELQETTDVLDKAGVKRKEAPVTETEQEPTPPPSEEQHPEMPDQEMMHKMAMKMADDLLVSLKDKLQNVSKEELTAALMSSMGMSPEPTNEEEETPPEEGEEQIMEDKAKKPTSSTSSSTPVAVATFDAEAQRAYADSLKSMVKDMSDIAEVVKGLSKQNDDHGEAIKSLVTVAQGLVKQIQALEEKINGRPRQASAAGETIIDPTSEAARALEQAAKKASLDNKKVLGIQVRE